MVTPPRLYFEEDELVPAGWYGFCGSGLWLSRPFNDWVQFQSASVLCLPRFPVWKGHVEDVGSSAGTNHVVVIEQVASRFVSVYGHVLFRARDWTASCDSPYEGSELLRVQSVAKGEEVWEEEDLFLGEVVEGSKVPGLVDLRTRGVRISSRGGKSAISVQ